jgi:threonine/homoserine/homoserine lactone efflux protein
MSLLTDILSFAAVAGLVTIIPGLDTAMVLRSTARNGRRDGVATALGINTGALVWGAGAAAGVSILLTASTVAYTALRIAGALYMVWLGSRFLHQALRDRGDDADAAGEEHAPHGVVRAWRRGLMTNLLNPKVGGFYVAVLPQFIPAHASHIAVGLLLAFVHDLESMVWFAAIILGTHSVRTLIRRRKARRAIDGATGTSLIAFGLKLGILSR